MNDVTNADIFKKKKNLEATSENFVENLKIKIISIIISMIVSMIMICDIIRTVF